jgi:hypothetical protein
LATALMLPTAANAEYAVLKNGQRLHITGYERAGEQVRLHVGGGLVTVPADRVVAIEPEDSFPTPAVEESNESFAHLIRTAAAENGVEEHLITSVIAAESNFNPRAVSRKNAQGLMQLMPATAARFQVTDVFDPAQNIAAGTRYLKELLARYQNDLRLALAAYNAGPERVARYGGVPPFPETRAYIRRVLRELGERRRARGAFSWAGAAPAPRAGRQELPETPRHLAWLAVLPSPGPR